MERKCKHPRPQSCDRFSQRHGLRALWTWNLDFRLAAEPQKSQTITLPTITRLKLLRLRVILELAWALRDEDEEVKQLHRPSQEVIGSRSWLHFTLTGAKVTGYTWALYRGFTEIWSGLSCMRADLFCPKNGQYRKSSIRPLGGLFISSPFETGA